MPERYLVINPDGSLNWLLIDRKYMVSAFHKVIGCDWLENVYTVLPDIVIIVDECGKIKQNPQPFNPIASKLYRGWTHGFDPIVGPAVVAAIHLIDGESDWCPLSVPELIKLAKYLQIDLSQAKEVSSDE